MQPERVRVRNLIQPLRIGAAGVNLNWQTKGRNQNRLISIKVLWMDVALDVGWNRIFLPAPLSQSSGKKFEPAAWGREATTDLVVNFHTQESAALFVPVRTGNRNDVRRGWFRRSGEYASQTIFADVFKLSARHGLFVNGADPSADFKRAIAPHEDRKSTRLNSSHSSISYAVFCLK